MCPRVTWRACEKRDSWPNIQYFQSGLKWCSNQCLVFSVFWCFDIWDFADFGGTAPPGASQFLKIVNNSLSSTLFICKPLNPKPKPQFSYLWSSHTQGHYAPALIIPGTGTRQLGTVPVPQSMLRLCKPVPASETTTKALDLLSLCLLTDAGAPPWCGLTLLLGPVSTIKYLYSGNDLLICYQYLNTYQNNIKRSGI